MSNEKLKTSLLLFAAVFIGIQSVVVMIQARRYDVMTANMRVWAGVLESSNPEPKHVADGMLKLIGDKQ